MTVDVAKLLAAGQPDLNGNIIPAGVVEVSANFRNALGNKEPILLSLTGHHLQAEFALFARARLHSTGELMCDVHSEEFFPFKAGRTWKL